MAQYTVTYPLEQPMKSRLHRAKQLCYQYNQTSPDSKRERKALLKKLLPNAESPIIEPNFYCDIGDNIHAGPGLFLNHNVTILDGDKVMFGERVLVGPNTVITATTHPYDTVERATGKEWVTPITIGNDVFIGACVTILPGVTIGDEVIIAAGATVSRSIPSKTTFIK